MILRREKMSSEDVRAALARALEHSEHLAARYAAASEEVEKLQILSDEKEREHRQQMTEAEETHKKNTLEIKRLENTILQKNREHEQLNSEYEHVKMVSGGLEQKLGTTTHQLKESEKDRNAIAGCNEQLKDSLVRSEQAREKLSQEHQNCGPVIARLKKDTKRIGELEATIISLNSSLREKQRALQVHIYILFLNFA